MHLEVLLAHTGLDKPAIGKMVHDIGLKGGKFGRKETTGIAHLMAGIAATNKDPQRLERGVLDAFYEYFRRKRA